MSNNVNLNNHSTTDLYDINAKNTITNSNNTYSLNSNSSFTYTPYTPLSYTPLYILYQAPLYKPYKITNNPPSNIPAYLPYQSPSLELKETYISSLYQEPTNSRLFIEK